MTWLGCGCLLAHLGSLLYLCAHKTHTHTHTHKREMCMEKHTDACTQGLQQVAAQEALMSCVHMACMECVCISGVCTWLAWNVCVSLVRTLSLNGVNTSDMALTPPREAGRAPPSICARTHRQTDTHTYTHFCTRCEKTEHMYRGKSLGVCVCVCVCATQVTLTCTSSKWKSV